MEKPILNTLGRNLQNLRIAKGLSLSQLALEAGIAKSNLSRIEQGSGNPTIDTIWRLAKQLDVPFGSLVVSMAAPIDDDGVQVKLIEQGMDNPQVDAYWMSCAPNIEHRSDAHSNGTTETITVITGHVETGVEGSSHCLSAGESVKFPADKPHMYKTGDLWTTLLVTITYAKREVQDGL
ncbi:helix-turn-helix transcriptional regulator [Vibrio sp. SCSIO 43136]|uniref:helix-turn-helix domain-containing protein n=1 Tax=Vibrio sp. SCSIO 43136 TaxID=2819101 RepID=UPI002075E00B|nr:helix-turn-helix transcriptional regulator [Vibrio sp. SCSIO 43136]USD66288.1 helix-turn-helix domain-containing protein [Vibrio sp. SCSIO 43136]